MTTSTCAARMTPERREEVRGLVRGQAMILLGITSGEFRTRNELSTAEALEMLLDVPSGPWEIVAVASLTVVTDELVYPIGRTWSMFATSEPAVRMMRSVSAQAYAAVLASPHFWFDSWPAPAGGERSTFESALARLSTLTDVDAFALALDVVISDDEQYEPENARLDEIVDLALRAL